MRIYLDMDGVCTNFVAAAIDCVNRELKPEKRWSYREVIDSWPKGEYSICPRLGLSDDEFWKIIDAKGSYFWQCMNAYPWFDALYSALKSLGDVYFCTSPSRSCESAAGKIMWLQKRFGVDFRAFILTKHKHLLANRDSVLIDDDPVKIGKFADHGGCVYLFPRPWNNGPSEHVGNTGALIAQAVMAATKTRKPRK